MENISFIVVIYFISFYLAPGFKFSSVQKKKVYFSLIILVFVFLGTAVRVRCNNRSPTPFPSQLHSYLLFIVCNI